MKKSKWMLGAAAMLALSVALAGCGGGDKKADNKAAGVKGSLMVYTSIYPDIIDNMCKPNVAKAFPDMKVNWFQGGTEKVITKITGRSKACCYLINPKKMLTLSVKKTKTATGTAFVSPT